MLIQTLLNEAPKSSSNYSHIAPLLDEDAENRYRNVVKFFRILGHAAHLRGLDLECSVGAKTIAFKFYMQTNKSDGVKICQKRMLDFWTNVADYFEQNNTAGKKITYGIGGLKTYGKKNEFSKKNLIKDVKTVLDGRTDVFWEVSNGYITVTLPPKEKIASKHDYDTILQDVKSKNKSLK